MNRLVTGIWSALLIVTGVAVVPRVLNLLGRALAAARNIERYTAEILQGGVGIAGNTANVAALKDTLAVAPQLLAGATSIQQHAAAIETALSSPSTAPDAGAAGATDREVAP